MIQSSGIGTAALIVTGVLLVLALPMMTAIIVMGPRRYREWEQRHESQTKEKT